MMGNRSLFAAANGAIFAGVAVGLALRGIEGQGWTFALILGGFALNLVFLLLGQREKKAIEDQRKEDLMEELRQEEEERKERRRAERN